MNDVREAMQKTILALQERVKGIGTDIDDNVIRSCNTTYGVLLHIATIDRNGRKVLITPYDSTQIPTLIQDIKNCGFDATLFSKKSILVQIPLPSGEAQAKVKAHLRTIAEEAKVSIRNIRRHFKTKDNEKAIQTITDGFIQKIDELTAWK